MVHDLLLKLTHLLLESVDDAAKFGVLTLQDLHLVLKPRDALQLSAPTFGGCHTVALSLSFQFDSFLALHVDGGHRGKMIYVCISSSLLEWEDDDFFCNGEANTLRGKALNSNVQVMEDETAVPPGGEAVVLLPPADDVTADMPPSI
ncbi:hypothetical protein B566_EDAN008090 [Ephemera danica]|nr:hypothetical protein B566_EDAN008090 [Ephemera danica]